MKFNAGYQLSDGFADYILQNAAQISEVYFAYGSYPNGRGRMAGEDNALQPWQAQARQIEELKEFRAAGIGTDLLLNGMCYGRDSQSRAFFNGIGDTVDWLCSEVGLSVVTTTSPLIAGFIKNNFPSLTVRASVNMEIGTVEGMRYLADRFDSFYMKRELNRDRAGIEKLTDWCRANGRELLMLANSGCLNNCSAHVFHDNLVSHEAEIAAMDNAYQFDGVCREFLRDPANLSEWLSLTNFVRPEDIYLYEKYFSSVKLATRVNRSPVRVLRAYIEGRYTGAVTDLCEPDHGGIIRPKYIENSKLPSGFGEHLLNCDKNCAACGYCRRALEDAMTDLDNSFYIGGSRD